MSQLPYELDLRDLMDTHYGAWSYRAGVGVGSDCGPAIADGVAMIRATIPNKRGKILIPPAPWLMNTSPGDLSGILIEGVQSQASEIIYNNASGVALLWSGAGGFTGGGVKGISLLLESGLGDTSAYGIMLRGDATFQADQTRWSDIYMSAVDGSSFWWDGVHVDGSARSVPQGSRVANWSEIDIFNCHNIGAYFSNAVQTQIDNFGCFTGKGPYGNAVMITGGSTHVYGNNVNATLNVSGVIDTMINGERYA